ncbi:MAG: outer membrane beta-barrel protein [Verrucomicrobia bacterium]|nr:outer membrane beta-barrel protein [Verrucomicrobiota bacterium]
MNELNSKRSSKLIFMLPMIVSLALQVVCIAAEPAKVSQEAAEPAEALKSPLPGFTPGLMDENPLKLGRVTVHPHLKAGFTYDDNVFIQQGSRIGDFYASVDPGVQFVYGESGRHRIALDYTADIQRFFRLSNQDTVNHNVALNGKLTFNQLSLDLKHDYQHNTEGAFQIGQRVTVDRNNTLLEAEYEFSPKTSLGAHYRQDLNDYVTPGLINNQRFELGATFYYHLTPKTDLLAELDGGMMNVSSGASGVYEQLSVGARLRMTGKLTGKATVGYQHWAYDQGLASTDAPAANVGLSAQLTRHCSLDVDISHTINPSPSLVSNYYTATRANIRVNERLWHDKITVYAGGGYERDEYQQSIAGQTRNDDHLEAQAGVDYSIREWWTTGLTYRYQNHNSTMVGLPFYDNQVSIYSSVRF